MPRLDTRLEAEGAEFLVLGQLLLQRIPSYKTYTNMPGYDLVATNPERNKAAKIQVKSRWSTGAASFPLHNSDCDFVVLCLLNRGNKKRTAKVKDPEYYVFPINVATSVRLDESWHKVKLSHISNVAKYRDNWQAISKFLKLANDIQRKAPSN